MPLFVVPIRFLILGLWLSFLSIQGHAAASFKRVEKSFKDPVTGKTGLYTIGQSEAASETRRGILAFFHGSGSTASYAASYPDIEAVAKELDLIPLAIQAPNGAATWPADATGPSNQHDLYAKSLLDSLRPAGRANDDKPVVLVGFSAGSTFLSGDFLPRYIQDYKGGAVLLCGGGGPVTMVKSLFTKLDKATADRFSIAVLIQKKDFLFKQTMQGVGYWKSRGANIHPETPEGGSHCGFDLRKEMSRLARLVLKPI